MIKKTLARLLLVIGLIIFSSCAFAVKCTEEQIRSGKIIDCELEEDVTTFAENVVMQNVTTTLNDLSIIAINNTAFTNEGLIMPAGSDLEVDLGTRRSGGSVARIDSAHASTLTVDGDVYDLGINANYNYIHTRFRNNSEGSTYNRRVVVRNITANKRLVVRLDADVEDLILHNVNILETNSQNYPVMFNRTNGNRRQIRSILLSENNLNSNIQILIGLYNFMIQGGNNIGRINIYLDVNDLEEFIQFLINSRVLHNIPINIIVDGIPFNIDAFMLQRVGFRDFIALLSMMPQLEFYRDGFINANRKLRFTNVAGNVTISGYDTPCIARTQQEMQRIYEYLADSFTLTDLREGIECREYNRIAIQQASNYHREQQQPAPRVLERSHVTTPPDSQRSYVPARVLRDTDIDANHTTLNIGQAANHHGNATTIEGNVRINGAFGGHANVVGGGGGGIRPVLTIGNSAAMTIRSSESNPLQVNYGAGSSRNIQEKPPGPPNLQINAIDLSSCLRCMVIHVGS